MLPNFNLTTLNKLFIYEYQIVKETGWTLPQIRQTESWWLERLNKVLESRTNKDKSEKDLGRVRELMAKNKKR